MTLLLDSIRRVRQEGSGRTHTYRIVYEVHCTNKDWGPQAIDYEFARITLLPDWGDLYIDRPINEGDTGQPLTGTEKTIDRESWLSDISSRFVKKYIEAGAEVYVYETTLEYTPIGEYRLDLAYNQVKPALDTTVQQPIGLPYNWQPVYQFSFSRRYVDRIEGRYGGTFKYPKTTGIIPTATIGQTPNWTTGEYRLITNSANVFYDPPARGTEADLVMRVKNYTPSFWQPNDGDGATSAGIVATTKFDYSLEPAEPVVVPPTVATYSYSPAVQFRRYIGRVNCTAIKHWDPEAGVGYGLPPLTGPTDPKYHTWPPYTLKLESLTSRAVRINGMYCFENDWEFHYREGMPTDDPDNPVGWTDVLPDVSRMQRASEDGKPCFEPITLPGGGAAAYDGAVLDGSGSPILYQDLPSGDLCDDSYWLLWLAERTAQFSDFNRTNEVAFFRWDDTIPSNPTVYTAVADPAARCGP